MTDPSHPANFLRTGMREGRHAPNLVNPPGQAELHWRLATAPLFFKEMKERLKYTTENGELLPTPTGPLTDLVRNPTTDWAAALMESWSVIGDILCFYQERLLNEGYIGTAMQPESITYLMAALGGNLGPASDNKMAGQYRFPGTAGSADVILSVRDGEGMPGSLILEKDKVLRRVTPKGGNPLDFVVVEDTVINSAWNKLSPRIKPPSQHPGGRQSAKTAGQIFMGTHLKLVPQALVFSLEDQSNNPDRKILQIETLRSDQQAKQTIATWHSFFPPPASLSASTSGEKSDNAPTPHYMTTQSFLPFGARAPDFSHQSLKTRMHHITSGGVEIWSMANGEKPVKAARDNLPPTAIQDMLISKDGTVYLATKTGVFYCTNDGASWQEANQGLIKRNVRSLSEDDKGLIYAGTVSGGAYRSLGSGAPWSSLPGGYIIKSSLLGGKVSLRTSLPATTVNKLVLGAEALSLKTEKGPPAKDLDGLVIAATDNGLFGNDQKGTGWLNIPLKTISSDQKKTSGSQPQSATPFLDAVLVSHQKKSFALTASEDALHMLDLSASLKASQQKKNPKKEEADAEPGSNAHGRTALPNALKVAFDSLAKIGQYTLLPLVFSAAKLWKAAKTAPALSKKVLEKIADVDPFHWAETGLPYPGSKIPYEGHFISLQIFPFKGRFCLALSTTKGLFQFDFQSSKLIPINKGLPVLGASAPTLSSVKDPDRFEGASLVLLLDNTVYGFKENGVWQPLISVPTPAEKPSTTPDYPEKIIPLPKGEFCLLRPISFGTQWPDFAFGNQDSTLSYLDITGLQHPVKAGTTGALVTQEGTHCTFFKILSSSQLIVQNYGLKSPVTRLQLKVLGASFESQHYDRRTAKILIEQRELFTAMPPSADIGSLNGNQLQIEGSFPDLTDRKISVSGPSVRILPIPIGGILSGSFSGGNFEPAVNTALPLHDIQALTLLGNTQILALAGDGLWQGTPKGGWRSANAGLAPDDLKALQAIPKGEQGTFLLTATNLYTRETPSEAWSRYSVPDIGVSFLSFLERSEQGKTKESGTKFLGTKGEGLFIQKPGEATWSHVDWTSLKTDSSILAMQEMPDGSVYISSAGQGLIHVNATLTNWKLVDLPPTLARVPVLRARSADLILSNERGALYQLSEQKGTYHAEPLFATRNKVQVLDICVRDTEILAGLEGSGLIRSTDGGQTWTNHSTGLCGCVKALLWQKDHWLMAVNSLQPSFPLQPKLRTSLPALVYSQQLDQAILSEQLISAFTQASIKLPKNPALHTLQGGTSWLLVSAIADTPAEKADPAYLLLKDMQKIHLYQLESDFPVIRYSEGGDGLIEQYEIAVRKGLNRIIDAFPGQVFPVPALKNDPIIKQVLNVTKSQSKVSDTITTLHVKPPLETLFDAKHCDINANIVALSQGQLIQNEPLGDGNAAQAFQSFDLKAGQLVYSQKTGDLVLPVLSVTVDGQPFEPISDLLNAGPHDRVYVLTLNEKGHATITFGDGINGCRLPNGLGNVHATYRANMSTFDASDEKAQFIMTEPPYGLSTIAPAAEQKAAAVPAKIKKGNTVSLNPALLPKRLVSHSDYETVAASLPSVAKSKLRMITFKRQKTLLLSVAGVTPKKLEQDTSALIEIRDIISRISLAPQTPLRISPVLDKPFCLSVMLTIQAGLSSAQKSDIAQQTFLAVKEKYGYQAAKIGASVIQHDVQRLLLQSSFVTNANLTALHYETLPPALDNLLAAAHPENPEIGEDLIYLAEEGQALRISLREKSETHEIYFVFPETSSLEEEAVC